MDSFVVTIGKAYYFDGFFNVRVKHSELFGKDLSDIIIELGENSEIFCQGAYVNRTANTNNTPRIMAGKAYRNWIKENFVQGCIFKVRIIKSDYIVLSKPPEN